MKSGENHYLGILTSGIFDKQSASVPLILHCFKHAKIPIDLVVEKLFVCRVLFILRIFKTR